jgi:stage II sporulation protein M
MKKFSILHIGVTQGRYLKGLRPYLAASVLLFGLGSLIGTATIFYFPGIADQLAASLTGFVKIFRGLPPLQLAGAIFFNNAIKTLLVIALGILFGAITVLFLIVNGAALGIVFYLSIQSRGLWRSLLVLLPHGILELPAVLLGTGIGLMLGRHSVNRLLGKAQTSLGSELVRAFYFFMAVIIPLLLMAAFVEAFVTPALAGL